MKKRLYLDSNIFIYSIEKHPGLTEILTELQADIDAGKIEAFTSELTLSEVLVKPIADQDERRIELYKRSLVSAGSLHVIPITREILISAATVRAIHRLKLPDAIHLATARLNGCTHLVTNDTHFLQASKIRVLSPFQLDEL